MGKWISIEESLPKPFVRVLVYDPEWHEEGDCVRMGEFDKTRFRVIDDGGWDTRKTVTHWMPLPGTPMRKGTECPQCRGKGRP